MKITDENLEKMWDEFDDISIDEEECIDVNFYNWKKGTDRYDIWHWFDENHSKGVAWLMGVV